jgi:hypothetical protein
MYDEGYKDGMNVNQSNTTWTNPCTVPYSNDVNGATLTSCSCGSNCSCHDKAENEKEKNEVKAEKSKNNTYTIKINGKPIESLNDILNTYFDAIPPKQLDAFDKLAKELNF